MDRRHRYRKKSFGGVKARSRNKPRERCVESGKIRYKEGEASAMAEFLSRRENIILNTYSCPHCGAWHLTSIPAWDQY